MFNSNHHSIQTVVAATTALAPRRGASQSAGWKTTRRVQKFLMLFAKDARPVANRARRAE